ncbi:hypothetical protein BXY41_11663 [Lacrimispora xylanisolvens]|uniref:Endonuclease n=1 Tax=Lacrimispora xylanisolvens TaxID=384636 RepID=A0A2S6HJ57_9FIRM|nr:hypothetical protein [Hungatella xylanolytica]PPK77524.1 hypothetical protein BXY41_11663 [Hungatella xylanolytica]
MNKYFKKDNSYPNEAFIQFSIEKYFNDLGYEIDTLNQVDLIARKNDECWIVEAKGITSSVGLDFNTCLGQLIKSMKNDLSIYSIAVPKHIKYKRQCKLIPDYFRQLIKLHILLIDEKGDVTIIYPYDDISDKFLL